MLEDQDISVMLDRQMLCYVRCSEEAGVRGRMCVRLCLLRQKMLCYVMSGVRKRVAGWMFDVRCLIFGCSMVDAMFGQADVILC